MVVGATRRRKVVFSTDETSWKPREEEQRHEVWNCCNSRHSTGETENLKGLHVIYQTNSALRMGIREHEETLMGLATLCIHVYKASQAMKGSFSRPKGLISVERRGERPSSSFHSHADNGVQPPLRQDKLQQRRYSRACSSFATVKFLGLACSSV